MLIQSASAAPTLQADLAITKTDGVTTVTPGGSVTYTITASNAGPDAANGATVNDTFPAILTGTWTCVGAGGGTCTAAGSGNINDTVNLPAGGSVTYTVSANIAASATGTLSNTATVTAPAGVTDPNPANNAATDSDTITPQADLAITKTDGVTTVTAGGSTTYTITASNAGPSNAPGAVVTDTFPATLTGTWTCVGAGGGTCTAAGSGNINDTVNLPSGGSVTYTVSANIAASATGTISNTATVIAPAGVTDPTPGNNSATDSDTVGATADLSITKTDGVTTVTAGGTTTYIITAINAGPSNAPGAVVADTFPAALTANWTCAGTGGGTCTASGSGNINDTVNLPSGGSVTYTAVATISATATGTISNTATVTAPAGVTDPNPANNSATDTDTVNAVLADLAITKTDGVTTVTPGGTTTYTITASNAGPNAANGAVVADTLPASLTGTWTCAGTGGGTCTASGSGNINDTVNLPAAATVTYTFVATISAAATGTISNTATVTAPAGVTDPNPANNAATDTDTVSGSTTTTLTSSNNPSRFGEPVTFTATVTSGSGTPTGTVTFKDGAIAIGTAALSGGVATLTTTTLTRGSHSITASYGGSGIFTPSTSAVLQQAVNDPLDSLKLRAMQILAAPVVAQVSGQAISGAMTSALNEALGGNNSFATMNGGSVRFNFSADPTDAAAAAKEAPKTSAAFTGDAASFPTGSPSRPGNTPSARVDNAFEALAYAAPTKAPPIRKNAPDWFGWAEVRGAVLDRWNPPALGALATAPVLFGNQVNLLAGLTWKASPVFAIGVLGGYETFDYRSDALTGRLKGDGWTVGSYLGWLLSANIRLEAGVAYSGIGYDGSAGLASASFSGDRLLVTGGLTGMYEALGWQIEPSARVYALWEHENAYMDSLGTQQASRDFSTGRSSGGVKVAYPFAISPGTVVAPYAGIYGDYYFNHDNAAPVVGIGPLPLIYVLDGWSARAVGGITARFDNGGQIAIGAERAGIGGNFGLWIYRARASIPFGAQ